MNLDKEFAACVKKSGGLLLHPGSGMFVRHRSDVFTVMEQQVWKGVLHFDDLAGNILDLGGHIGTSVYFFRKNNYTGKIVSVEPDPENIRVYKKNWQNEKNTILYEAAVVDKTDKRDHIDLYLGKTYTSKNCTHPVRGRQILSVPTVKFQDLLKQYKPAVIKCDIEGAEYNLNWLSLPKSVKRICMEVHTFKDDWVDKLKELDRTLLSVGFKHVRPPKYEQTFNRACIAIWSR